MMTLHIAPNPHCKFCHGSGTVYDSVDYGSATVQMPSWCGCVEEQIPEDCADADIDITQRLQNCPLPDGKMVMSKMCSRCSGTGSIDSGAPKEWGGDFYELECPDCEGSGVVNDGIVTLQNCPLPDGGTCQNAELVDELRRRADVAETALGYARAEIARLFAENKRLRGQVDAIATLALPYNRGQEIDSHRLSQIRDLLRGDAQ